MVASIKSIRRSLAKILKSVKKKKKNEKTINPSEICGSVIKEQEVKPQDPCNETRNDEVQNPTNDESISTKNSEHSNKDEKKDDCDTLAPREESEVRRDTPTTDNENLHDQREAPVSDNESTNDVIKVDEDVPEIEKDSSQSDVTKTTSDEKPEIARVGTEEMVDSLNNNKPASKVFCACI